LESLRTRRLLETAELALKKETAAKKQAETRLRQAEMRAIRAEDERTDRVKAEDALLVRVASCADGVLRFSVFFHVCFLRVRGVRINSVLLRRLIYPLTSLEQGALRGGRAR